VKLYLNTRYL